mgnify:CR=1 FL=1
MERYGLLGQEWQTLQGNHEQHELNALLIKLGCLALSVAGLASGLSPAWIAFTILLCWMQEGIRHDCLIACSTSKTCSNNQARWNRPCNCTPTGPPAGPAAPH